VELRQFVYVEAIARCGGFTRAAEQLHVAQPAVSTQIAALERELGIRLFDRTTRRVTLTQAGELLLGRARHVLAELAAIRDELDQLRGVLAGQLRIGATTVLGGLDLPRMIRTFRQHHPGVEVRLATGLLGELVDRLDDGSLDVVIGPIHDRLPDQYGRLVLCQEEIVLALPAHAEPAGHNLGDYAEQIFICLPPGSGLQEILNSAAEQHGFTPRIELEAATPHDIRALVSAGLGIALIARSIATQTGPAIRTVELLPQPAHPPIGLIQRPGPASPAAARFEQLLRDSVLNPQ
jgi:LysR family transcriptional activator of glutamate synthase operon